MLLIWPQATETIRIVFSKIDANVLNEQFAVASEALFIYVEI